MRELYEDIDVERQMKKRIKAGVVASMLSVALHSVLFFFIGSITFMLPSILERPKLVPNLPPIKLEDIRHEVKVIKPVPAVERGTGGDASGEGGGAGGEIISTAVGSSIAKGAESLALLPKEVITQPAPVIENRMAGEARSIVEPGPTPVRSAWQPRQEILQLEKKVVSDEISALPRKNIPKIERIRNATDVVAEVDRESIGKGRNIGDNLSTGDVRIEDLLVGLQGGRGIGGGTVDGVVIGGEPGKKPGVRLVSEDPSKITQLKALEKMLVIDVSTYSSLTDWKYGYLKVEIKRAGAEVLPIIPKDILLIQDSSNSMSEQRLHFCREGLIRCLAEIGPADRFNVVLFRERSQTCFPDWAEARQENIDKARKFIQDMKSEGNTDIFTAISEQMNVKRTPGRPVVALLVSDGIPTSGMIASSDIIGEFSKLNNGAISVFAMGTLQVANKYLLDLLGYCNRGDALVVTSGRWDIPDNIHRLMKEISRPVLADTDFHFPIESSNEVYPVLASNLYLDRPLVLFGRYLKGTKNIVFQAVGKAADVKCDMIFDVDLERNVKKGGRDIMDMWARQKIYHLIGQNARKPSQSCLDNIHETAREYGIKVPYRRQLK